jgi:selenium metabolism protein YedF
LEHPALFIRSVYQYHPIHSSIALALPTLLIYNEQMEYLDLKGKTCPIPVIETKKKLDEKDLEAIEILVDNDTACENVQRFLESRGFTTSVGADEDSRAGFRITATKGPGDCVQTAVTERKVLVFVDSDTLGRGSDELGKVLMKAFILTLKNLEERPWRIVFINSGVKLVAQGSDVAGQLKELEESGVEILSCGICLDYFHLKEEVAVGKVTNMFEAVSSFLQATHVIRP